MKKAFFSTILILLGTAIGFIAAQYVSFDKPTYVELPTDFRDSHLGVIKKGTKLKVDAASSESFTRYILYINISDEEQLRGKKTTKYNVVIPYWISSK